MVHVIISGRYHDHITSFPFHVFDECQLVITRHDSCLKLGPWNLVNTMDVQNTRMNSNDFFTENWDCWIILLAVHGNS